jgi:hypothetical protein
MFATTPTIEPSPFWFHDPAVYSLLFVVNSIVCDVDEQYLMLGPTRDELGAHPHSIELVAPIDELYSTIQNPTSAE